MTNSFPIATAAWNRMVRNFKRMLMQMIIGWLINLCPSEDKHTFKAIAALLDATDRDDRETA